MLAGELTARDITRPGTWRSSSSARADRPPGKPRIGFSARTTIGRRDFGVTFGLVAGGSRDHHRGQDRHRAGRPGVPGFLRCRFHARSP
ncbi:hypothetical protein J4557_45985 [Actinomadura nitritigenes]|uniref:Lipid/polyisoprenoid-binding YceI-like domain-containing protein n=1 Tax=Actinomadura nitritigenes TaxID=134602 RepID=A0ABS3RF85_9ACTN|nr:hypothetical protein [Actinomadura nitritigenes]